MSFFSRIADFVKAVPKEELVGVSIQMPCWKATPTKDASHFFTNLPNLLPAGAILYFESAYDKAFCSLLKSQSIAPLTKLAIGTIWPRPDIYHVPLSENNIQELLVLINKDIAPAPSIHFHAYKDNIVLLQWHDAFYGDPILISKRIGEETVQTFCDSLGLRYSETSDEQ